MKFVLLVEAGVGGTFIIFGVERGDPGYAFSDFFVSALDVIEEETVALAAEIDCQKFSTHVEYYYRV